MNYCFCGEFVAFSGLIGRVKFLQHHKKLREPKRGRKQEGLKWSEKVDSDLFFTRGVKHQHLLTRTFAYKQSNSRLKILNENAPMCFESCFPSNHKNKIQPSLLFSTNGSTQVLRMTYDTKTDSE